MRQLLAPLAIAAAILALPLSDAEAAGGERNWTVCGGAPYAGYSGFALCASVTATVQTNALGQHVLTMKVYNLSGMNGSYSGTVFTSLGLDNVIPTSVNVVAGSLKITGPCIENPAGCDYSKYWDLQDNKAIGGGVKVDLLAGSFNSQQSIASRCGVNAGTTPGHNRLFVTDCVGTGPNFVTMSFRVTEAFNPNTTGDLFIKGQNGYNGQSTHCISTQPNCVPTNVPPPPPPPTTVVPEPVTMTLFATGMGLWGGVGYIRRRRKEAVSDV